MRNYDCSSVITSSAEIRHRFTWKQGLDLMPALEQQAAAVGGWRSPFTSKMALVLSARPQQFLATQMYLPASSTVTRLMVRVVVVTSSWVVVVITTSPSPELTGRPSLYHRMSGCMESEFEIKELASFATHVNCFSNDREPNPFC